MRCLGCSTMVMGALLAGCFGAEEGLPAPLAVDVGAGFAAAVHDGNRLVVATGAGRVLLDGLAPAVVAPDGPPVTGFAVRAGAPDYQMQLGAFQPDVAGRGAWQIATRVRFQPGPLEPPPATTGDGGAGGASAGAGGEAGSNGDAGAAEPLATTATVELLGESGELLARVRFAPGDAGHLVANIEAAKADADQLSWGFRCSGDDHFLGLGAQSWDVDHRGQTVPCLVEEQGIGKSDSDEYGPDWFVVGRRHSSYAPIPQLLSRRGFVLVADSPLPVTFALCSEQESAARVELELPARVHLFDGPTPAAALERASELMGRPRMPPTVAFAPWIDAVFGSENVRRVAARLREERIPSSVVWTEDWRGGQWNGDTYETAERWDVDRSLYPDAEGLASDLHRAGFQWHVYFNPFVYEGSEAWQQTQPNGWLVRRRDGTDYRFAGTKDGATGLLDLDNPAARAWAIEKMREAIALGADGWLNDAGEWLPFDAVTAAGPGRYRHNQYPLEWQRVAREAIDGMDDGVERLFYARSSWLGGTALADVFVAGSQQTTFEPDDGLPTILPIGIGLGATGISTYGHDIAGYHATTDPAVRRELFYRWTELGAWSPVMRTHHGAEPALNWSWDRDAATIAHFRRYAALHMSLVPYFAGLAKVATDTGVPIWRALALEFPEDERVWPIADQVMVGSGVMIAPMTRAAAVRRPVLLPAGRWYRWEGGGALPGGDWLEADADLKEIPVFARAGAVVPTYPPGVMTLVNGSLEVPDPRAVGDDRIVFVFLGAHGSFEETGGLGYELTRVSTRAIASPEMVWGGEPLGLCGDPVEPPCVERGEDGATVHAWGPGTLEVVEDDITVAHFEVAGGNPLRRMTIVLRW